MIVVHRPLCSLCCCTRVFSRLQRARDGRDAKTRPVVDRTPSKRLHRQAPWAQGRWLLPLLTAWLLWAGRAHAQVPAAAASPSSAPTVQAVVPPPPPAPTKPRAATIPPLRLATGPTTTTGTGIVRVLWQRGDAVYNHGGDPPEEALNPSSVLAARDEVITRNGSVELIAPTGTSLQLGNQGLAALLARDAVYLARGELTVLARNDQAPQMFYVATPCGRSWVRAREARVRVEGNTTSVEVIDGWVRLGGNNPGAVDVRAGQASRCTKGQPPSAPHALLAPPSWLSIGDLFLTGEPTRDVNLRFSPVLGAARYRLELLRFEGGAEPILLSSQELGGDQGQVELRNVEVGSYHARLFSIDDTGTRGIEGQPLRFLVARVAGLSATGMVHTGAGQMPPISGPAGLSASILLDGEVPQAGAPRRGMHRLRVLIAGLYADVPLNATAVSEGSSDPTDAPPTPPTPPAPAVASVPSVASAPSVPTVVAPVPPAALGTGGSPVAVAASEGPTQTGLPPAQPSVQQGAEDVLLGGLGEVPLDGLRSPWARSTVGGRIEFTTHNTLRVAVGGRLLLRNGFGADVWVSALRAAFLTPPTGRSAAGFGNIHASLRTPALRRSHFALQGLVSLLAPTSTSYVDRSIAVDPAYSTDGSQLRVDALPDGTGWRTEAAALVGVNFGRFHLFTNHGASLRVAPTFSAAYVGGIALQADVLSLVRFVSFASWEVGYLGLQITPESTLPDAGGAIGGGIEVPLALGKRGVLRLALLGRAGLGQVGAAIYGRGAVGLQAGYVFQ